MREAAEHGHLHVVRWAHENGARWDADCAFRAARAGHLEILKYMHARGCAMDARVCFIAMYLDHVDMLAWARAVKLPEKTKQKQETCEERDKRAAAQYLSAHPGLVN